MIHILHKNFQKIEEKETLPKSFSEAGIHARNENQVLYLKISQCMIITLRKEICLFMSIDMEKALEKISIYNNNSRQISNSRELHDLIKSIY